MCLRNIFAKLILRNVCKLKYRNRNLEIISFFLIRVNTYNDTPLFWMTFLNVATFSIITNTYNEGKMFIGKIENLLTK